MPVVNIQVLSRYIYAIGSGYRRARNVTMCGRPTTCGINYILADDKYQNMQNIMTAVDITNIKITYTIHTFKLQQLQTTYSP